MDSRDEGRFDDLFLVVLQQCEKLEPFLDHFFNFLYRRTDLYRIMRHQHDTMGFKPGVAEETVRKYQKWAHEAAEVKAQQKMAKPDEKQTALKDNLQQQQHISVTPHSQESPDTVVNEDCTRGDKMKTQDLPELRALPTKLDAYNGSVTDNYIWSQSLTDVDIKVLVPAGTRAKDVTVNISNQHLRVALKKPHEKKSLSGKEWPQVFIDGRLPYKVKANESMWNMDGSTLQVSLEKCEERMWKYVIEGETEIDTSTLDASKDISEFDNDAQAAFRKVVYDHHQKMQGKPTSEEEKMCDVLKQAWDKDGSPFKGTPFDPSVLNMHTSSGTYFPPHTGGGQMD
ncbi:nudC domain-containing protein 3-like isoform X2 [Corticium candelabrum]|uniref:nudC domain-containing protein 3-like isoform X2 n=1 Tax=Corticium candelabrum TaxID=121492 RepID=UPI002E2F5F9F|nr:nudC domain-containing protein 3-like isoform X2 [Corticium candelabrum]